MLAVLKELQSAHDGLRTIERDLNAFPPEMARLSESVKVTEKRIQEIVKNIGAISTQVETLEKQHQQAVKAEAHARQELKASSHKVQYTAAMRELDEKERQLDVSKRALKEAQANLKKLEEEKESLLTSQSENQRQFDELHEIFLSEHENQVTAKGILTEKIADLEGKLDKAMLNKFHRLMQTRNGRVVVAMENNVCTGCNTKLRMPLIYRLRAEGSLPCESCQRILYIPE